MGRTQYNSEPTGTKGRGPLRGCLRKGCAGIFLAVRWNQRYCGDSQCRREILRWQAAKRQRTCRQSPESRARHAAAERARRARLRQEQERATQVSEGGPSQPQPANGSHQDGAWSRGKMLPLIFCDRPGCYEPVTECSRAPVRYCTCECRGAMRRVRDRERKWLLRHQYGLKARSP
jgi:hypothetical protein